MSSSDRLLQKLLNGTIKKSEVETFLKRLGFSRFRGRGSHEVWGRDDLPDLHIVIATHTKEVPRYQIKQIEASLRKRGLL